MVRALLKFNRSVPIEDQALLPLRFHPPSSILYPLQRQLRRAGFLLALLAATRIAPAQRLDLNSNGISDVWELTYGAEGCNPNADSNGDGLANRLEAIAGTNPFDKGSAPRIGSLTVTADRVEVHMAGALGKRYELQASEVVAGGAATNWITEADLIARTNPTVTLAAPAGTQARFYRMVISDVDTDGDGLNDWEEYQLGLDPFSPSSNGGVDGHGKPLSDYRYAASRPAFQDLARSAAASPTEPKVADYALSAGATKAGLVIYPSAGAAAGTGLTGEYFLNSSLVYTNIANFNPGNVFLTRIDPTIDFIWGPDTDPNLSNVVCCVRWTGQVQPKYSETYVFGTRTDDGVKLWVNDQLLIDKWQGQSVWSWTNVITLQAGVRYNLRMEYLNRGSRAEAHLFWYSPSQPREIVPASQLYPDADVSDPGGITSPLTAVAFLGQPFNYTIVGANSPFSYGATNLPPGLRLDSTNGIISGIPTRPGTFEIPVSATNHIGATTASLQLQVIDTGSSVMREVWLDAPGKRIADIPLQQPASLTNTLGSLEGIPDFGDNYGERIRGYLTPPVTGNYYFWIAANSAAELWISDDEEPANKVRRAYVLKATAPHEWNDQPTQKSAWLALEAGRRYYLEILHKAAKSRGDHWSVGWLQDPTGTNSVPEGVVPGYVLSPFVDKPSSLIPGILYSANMVAQSGAQSSGVGSATLRVSADGTRAVLRFSYSGLSSTLSGEHIHSDPYLSHPSEILFDIDAATPQADGSYVWNIVPVGTLSAADILEIIRQGKAYINLHTVNYPSGEINGHFTLAAGTQSFTPPPPPPQWVDDHKDTNAAARFLLQATFGPSLADLKVVRSMGYERWINKQFKLRPSSHLKHVLDSSAMDPGRVTFNTWWQRSVTAPDQLRQRVAFALSEIMVVSGEGVLNGNYPALSSYYDLLLKDAFGNFRDLLRDVTLSPAMGLYLDMRRNDKGNLVTGTHPNENYAREIMQLFSIGLNRMWPDGSLVLNSKGDPVPTYDQDVIIGYARAFTGWNYYQTNEADGRLPINWNPSANYTNPMVLVPAHHELGTKRLLDNIVLPAAQGDQADPSNPAFDRYGSQDLEKALDAIFYNENVGPFVCRQLIQRLVTSNPSRDYVYRVAQKFDDNGSGVRGDMKAVIKAILLDYEARSPAMLDAPSYGKQREPLLRASALARAFPAPGPLKGTYRQNGSEVITITTHKPHRLSSRDDVFLDFGNSKRKAIPMSQIYYNVDVLDGKTLSVTAPGISTGTYSQSGTTITVTNSDHGLAAGEQIYLTFTSGGAPDGIYTVTGVAGTSVFTVAAPGSAARSGSCFFPEWTGGSFVQSGTTITFTTVGPHGVKPGDTVYVRFPPGAQSPDGVYRIDSVPGSVEFTVTSSVSANQSESNPLVLPLSAPPLKRSGKVAIRYSTWNMNHTDNGSSPSLGQTPLNSPTVFNFYFPDYKFPGALAAAGLTTPEFQLTSDTSVVLQMNFLTGGIFNNRSNTNGLSSFSNGNGAIVLDLGPWMTPAYTSDAGIPALVDALNSLLCAGQLSPAASQTIVSYVASPSRFPYRTPTLAQMRDRVQAVVHLIATSPDFTIQR